MIERHLMRLRARDTISAEEEAAIRSVITETREIGAHRTIVRAGTETTACTLLLDGLACRAKDMRDGQRQITELNVAGDFIDLHGFTLKRLDHSLLALTKVKVGVAPHDRVKELVEAFPHLGRVYWFSTNLDAAIHREWVLSLGRRTALGRLANLFCELQVRLGLVGLSDEGGYDLDLTQADLAECMGLTPVHVNRTLREMRERELLTFREGRVTIIDAAGLRKAAEFDPAYLYLERRAE
ncbi:CRP-like cAMP-binding protein [Sphingomonas jejuensis]|uniref:CRP-like cAMP-binding protein n=1 Tax=Sphingomonas jejuensis TaxID=904715 RepID=A0ABX0XML6_9SPHN|nr:Crp/Fnr family transcriptional regulator [Sphingomonas jejuensis]NJC34623.1 CRP-like cAMP-binding protein [Sphingomonas jejuensis]